MYTFVTVDFSPSNKVNEKTFWRTDLIERGVSPVLTYLE